MPQPIAIADRVELKGQTSNSVAASQREFTVNPIQHVYSCWGLGADGRLTETWCKTRPNRECRAICSVWTHKAA
jgi:hypothetical protein